jgi:hypothetical protein
MEDNMKTMSEHFTGNKFLDAGLLSVSWICGFISLNITMVPIILSSIASVLACINYYYQIKKNKK